MIRLSALFSILLALSTSAFAADKEQQKEQKEQKDLKALKAARDRQIEDIATKQLKEHPQEAQKDLKAARDRQIEDIVTKQLKEHPQEAQKAVDAKVAEKIERIAARRALWQAPGGEAKFVSLPRLYFGNSFLRGDPCSGAYCRPNMVMPFGLEGAVHIFGIFDVFARLGGVALMYGHQQELIEVGLAGKTKFGMDVSAGLRLHIFGYVGFSAAYLMQTEKFDTVGMAQVCDAMGCTMPPMGPSVVEEKELTSHGAYLAVYGSLKGVTVSGFARLLYRQAIVLGGEQRGDSSAHLGVELVTPAIFKL